MKRVFFITIDREDSKIVKYEAVVHAAPIPQARRGGGQQLVQWIGYDSKFWPSRPIRQILAESADKKSARRDRGKP
jgi:hypothetical protein